MSTAINPAFGPDFAARARASWAAGIVTEAQVAAARNMTLEGYQEHKKKIVSEADGYSSGSFNSIADAAAVGRSVIDNLREHVASINGHAAHLDPRNLRQLADLFGQEWANDYKTRLEGFRAGAVELLGVKQQQINERFEVSGSLTSRESDGSYTLGAFALGARVGNAVTRIGSDGRVLAGPDSDSLTVWSKPADAKVGPETPLDLRA